MGYFYKYSREKAEAWIRRYQLMDEKHEGHGEDCVVVDFCSSCLKPYKLKMNCSGRDVTTAEDVSCKCKRGKANAS